MRSKKWLCVVAVVFLLGGYVYWSVNRPLPNLTAGSAKKLVLQTPAAKLSWPNNQASVGIVGSQVLQNHGAQTPLPTASTAKLITALAVLHEKPLKSGEQGPAITLGPADVAIYDSYVAKAGSVVPVASGEQVTEYQMLEAMMLPSANNMADSLAIWAFGSLANYQNFANVYLKQLGLTATHVGSDASGFDPSTTSTAHDLTIIGELTMQNPVLAQIVGLRSVDNFPVANTIKNVNFLLGNSNIVGVKTGNTDSAGGVFVGAARMTINSQPLTIVTAVMGAPNLWQAMHDSLPLIQSAQANFSMVKVVSKNSVVGHYRQPWGGQVAAVAVRDLDLQAWNGSSVQAKISLQSIETSARAGQTVGKVSITQSSPVSQKSVSVKLQNKATKPTAWWRLTHPF